MVGILRAVAGATASRRARQDESAPLQDHENDALLYGAFNGPSIPERDLLRSHVARVCRERSPSLSSASSSSSDFPSFESFRRQHIVVGTLACILVIFLFCVVGTLAWPGRAHENRYPHPILWTHFVIGAVSWLASDALRKPLFQVFPQAGLASNGFLQAILRSLPHGLLAM
jgi:hypothetical protein